MKALSYLHGCRVAYRNLKLDNILIAEIDPLIIILSDFGLSKAIIDDPLKIFCGTRTYAAPEVISRQRRPTLGYRVLAGIWSAGLIVLG